MRISIRLFLYMFTYQVGYENLVKVFDQNICKALLRFPSEQASSLALWADDVIAWMCFELGQGHTNKTALTLESHDIATGDPMFSKTMTLLLTAVTASKSCSCSGGRSMWSLSCGRRGWGCNQKEEDCSESLWIPSSSKHIKCDQYNIWSNCSQPS